jgi:hypothetical protein
MDRGSRENYDLMTRGEPLNRLDFMVLLGFACMIVGAVLALVR